MAGKIISTKLIIEGESEYKRSLSSINATLGILKTNLNDVKANFAGQANTIDALKAKQEALAKVQQATTEKVAAARGALDAAKAAQQQYAAQVETCTNKLTTAEKALADYQRTGKGAAEEEKKIADAVVQYRLELETAEKVNEKAQNAVAGYAKKLDSAQREQTKFNTEAEKNKKYLDEARKSTNGCATSIDQYGKKTAIAEKQTRQMEEATQTLATALVGTGLKAGFEKTVEAINSCVDASISFESAMAGVRRTVGGSEGDISALGDAIKRMALEMPITTEELSGIAETAGQLGVSKDQVEEFTRVMAMLGTTTDLAAADAATLLAQFSNITGLTDFERLGSTVAELGDATATTASKVVEMAQGMAAAADIAGFQETDILALSAAVGSLGVEAQAGSTAMSTLISSIYKEVETGGEKLEQFASVAGMSARDFSNAWQKNAAGAFTSFIEGLNRNEKSAVVLLDELGINNVRQTKAILGLANAGDLLSKTMEQAGGAWEENTALAEKAGIMYETTEAKMTLLSNSVEQMKAAIGDDLTPTLNRIAEAGADAFTWAAEFVEENPWLVSALAGTTAAVGALTVGVAGLAVVQKVIPLIRSFTAALNGIPGVAVAAAITGVVVAIGSLVAASKEAQETYTKSAKAAEESRQTYQKTAEALAENRANTLGMLAAVEELAGKESKTAAEKAILLELVHQLNEAVPELSLAYDDQADSLNMTVSQLEAYINTLLNQEEAQATVERMAEVMRQQRAIASDLAEAEKALADAEAEEARMKENGTYWAKGYESASNLLGQEIMRCKARVDELTSAQKTNDAEIEAAGQQYGELTTSIKGTGESISDTSDKAEAAASHFVELKAVISGVKGGYQLLSKAQGEAADSGYLTLDTVEKLISSGLEDYLEEVEGGYRLANGALEDYMDAQKAEYTTALGEAKAAAVALISQNSDEVASIDETTDAIRRKIEALQAEARVKMNAHFAELASSNDFANKGEAYMRQVTENDLTIKYLRGVESSAANALLQLDAAEKKLGTVDRAGATLARDYGTKTSGKSSGKTSEKEQSQAEKDLEDYKSAVAELDHQRAMDEISEREYYTRKGEYVDQYLTENADERKKWDEELHAWQKGAYDRDLTELKEALENEKITREEYLDGLNTLQEQYFEEGTDEWLAAERQRQKEITQYNQDAYDDQRADLDYFHRMGIYDDQQYYTELARLRDTYLEQDSAAWRSATLELHDWIEDQRKAELEAAEKAYQDQLKALQEALDAELDALKDGYEARKAAAKEAYQAQKDAAKQAYDDRKQQIKDELAAEKNRLNAIIAGIDAEIQARKELREDEDQDAVIAAAQKRLTAAKAQLEFARTNEDRAQWGKEVLRLQEALEEAIRDKEDTAFYREKEAEKDAVREQISAAEDAADKALTEAESNYNAKVAQLEAEYQATLKRLEAEYQAAVSRLESKYASKGESSSGGGGKTYSDEVRAIARAHDVDLGVAQDMYNNDQRHKGEDGYTPYASAAKSAADSMARAVGAVADTVTRAVTQTTTNITRNAAANVTINEASSLTSGQISAAVQKTLDKLSR